MARGPTTRLSNPSPLPSSPSSVLNELSPLDGQLNSDGIASLKFDSNPSMPVEDRPRSMKIALDSIATQDSGTDSETASEEDYDLLKHDPTAVIIGGRGGGFNGEGGLRQRKLEETKEKVYEGLKAEAESKTHSRSRAPSLKSIPITLKKSDQKGKYLLTADDQELSEILRIGLEKVAPDPSLRVAYLEPDIN
jgi:sterol O-acyltransferase